MEAMRNDLITKKIQEKAVKVKSKQKSVKKVGLVLSGSKLKLLFVAIVTLRAWYVKTL